MAEDGPKLRSRMAYVNATKPLSELGQQAKKIEANRIMTSDVKRLRLDAIEQQRGAIARRVNDSAMAARQ